MDARFGAYIGIPFKEHGRDHGGCDCWGLVRLIYREMYGADLPAWSGRTYRHRRDFPEIAKLFAENQSGWIEVRGAAPVAGDVVLLRIEGLPVHLGVFVEKGKMLHVEHACDAVIERLTSAHWRNRVVGFFRWRGIGDSEIRDNKGRGAGASVSR